MIFGWDSHEPASGYACFLMAPYKMKEEYDFSNAEQGRFFVPIEDIQVPIYLDKDILQYLHENRKGADDNLQELVNDLLRKAIEIARRVAS